jgi:Regulator of ribonuclease activity B
LRRKHGRFTGSDDGSEDTGGPYDPLPIRVRSDARLDGGVMNWLADPDGDALLRLAEDGFDFSKPGLVEFSVDFRSWPPPRGAMACLSRDYPSASVCVTDDDHDGYLEFQVYALVSYELVTNIQSYVTELMAPYHGVCASWDVVRSVSSL